MNCTTKILNTFTLVSLIGLTACGGNSTPTPTPTPSPTPAPIPIPSGSGAINSSGAINVISSTNSIDPATTYGASLQAVAESSHSLYLLAELNGLQQIIGDAAPSDCAAVGNPTVSQSGQNPSLGGGTFVGGETFSACGTFGESTLAYTGAFAYNLMSNTATSAAATLSWTAPITINFPGATNLSSSLVPGSVSGSVAINQNGLASWLYYNASSNPGIAFSFGSSSNYSVTNLNANVIVSGCSASGNTCLASFNSNGGNHLLANITKGAVNYAVTVSAPVTLSTNISSAIGNFTGGIIDVNNGNASCATLTVNFLNDGTGFNMSCSTAPAVTQQVLFSSNDWQTVFASANK